MSNDTFHHHGISVSSSLHNTAATPTVPSNPEYALNIGGSTLACPRTPASKVTALDPRTTGSLTLPQRADHTAVPELEGQFRHEDEDSRPPLTRTCQEPPAPASSQDAMTRTTGLASPSEFTPAQQLFEDRNPRLSSSHAMNATHGDPPRASVTPRLHLRTRGSSRHTSASLSSTPRDSPRDCRKRPPPGSTQQPTYVDRP